MRMQNRSMPMQPYRVLRQKAILAAARIAPLQWYYS